MVNRMIEFGGSPMAWTGFITRTFLSKPTEIFVIYSKPLNYKSKCSYHNNRKRDYFQAEKRVFR